MDQAFPPRVLPLDPAQHGPPPPERPLASSVTLLPPDGSGSLMRPLADKWSVVLIGRWNVSIFNPAWLTQELFGVPEIQMEFATLPGLPPRFISGDVKLIPRNSMLVVAAATPTAAAMASVERIASRTLELLSHTPVNAVGINFAFEETAPEPGLFDRFPDPCGARLADQGFAINQHVYTWRLNREGQTLNLNATVRPDNVAFDFNFHSDTADTRAARAAIDGRVAGHLDVARRVLAATFGVEEDEA